MLKKDTDVLPTQEANGLRIDDAQFFAVDAERLAINLLGKALVRVKDGKKHTYIIAETECYMGVEDTACHACRGKTERNSVLWERGGTLYVRLIYGLYYMLNVVAGSAGDPMGVLIRGVKEIKGPGRLTRALDIGKDFNREDILTSDRIWIEDIGLSPIYDATPRIGIGYAAKADIDKPWRFVAYKYL